MRISGVDNSHISIKGQAVKENPAESNFVINKNIQTVPLETSKAYVATQINYGYKEIQSFEVPYVGKGKLYELSNGHKVILIPKKAGPTTVYTSIKAGNLNEPANLKQISHLLEHLVDNNCTDAKDEEVKDIINKTGADCNALTKDYSTDYHISSVVYNNKDLESLLKVQAKTLLNKNFTEEEIELEKKIITQELDSKNYVNGNSINSKNIAIQNLFSLEEGNASISLPGHQSIKNISKEDLINYYDKFYQPENMVTTIVGSVDDNTIKLAVKYLGDKSFANSQVDIDYPEISTNNLIKKTIRKDVMSKDKDTEDASVHLSFIGPNNNDEYDNLKLDAVKRIFMNRVFKKINNKDKDDENLFFVHSNDISSKTGFPTIIDFYCSSKNYNCEKSLKELYSNIYDIANNPISDEELEKMKKDMSKVLTYSKESSLNMAKSYTESALLNQNFDEFKFVNDINLLTKEDIQETAKKYLDLNKASLVVIHPYKTPFDKVKKINEVSFKGNTDPLDSKDIHEYVLPNNLRVVIDSCPGITKTVVDFNLHSKKKIYTNAEAASFLNKILYPREIKDKLLDADIDYNFYGNSQRMSSSLSGDTDKTMEILNDAIYLLKPTFSKKDFSEIKSNILESREADGETYINDEILDEMFIESIYYDVGGDLKGLELEDVKELHNKILKNAQGTIFITLPKEKLKTFQSEIFKTLTGVPELQPYAYKAVFDKVNFAPLNKTKVYAKGNDDNQIEIQQYFKIIESGNIKDRAGLIILNQILGVGNKSMLFKKIREQDKIAYSANSGYIIDTNTEKMSRFILETQVKATSENLHKVLDEYKTCLNELMSKPISGVELETFKTKIKNDIICELESSTGRNNALKFGYNSFYGVNYLDELFKAIDEMTPEYLQQLAKHYFTQPYLLSVEGNKEVIASNKKYLSEIGKYVELE